MLTESGSRTIARAAPAQLYVTLLRHAVCGALLASLAGCVLTGGSVHEVPGDRIESRHSKNAGDVALYDEATKPPRPYTVVANVEVWGRILTAVSSRPTRGDVDEALRAKAANLGADAVINVHYHTSRAGVWPRGRMTAAGEVVVFDTP